MDDRIEQLEQLENLVTNILTHNNIELVDLQVKRRGRSYTIEIFADRPEGGISLDDCGSINKQIVEQIESENLFLENYSLAVSSPGLDWPLKTQNDFLRVLNKEVRFLLNQDGKFVEFSATVSAALENQVMVQVDGREQVIFLEQIKKAVQLF